MFVVILILKTTNSYVKKTKKKYVTKVKLTTNNTKRVKKLVKTFEGEFKIQQTKKKVNYRETHYKI